MEIVRIAETVIRKKKIDKKGVNMGDKEIIQRNSTMDIFKGFACIGVVLIHVAFPGTTGEFVRALGRFGVPIFFCVSGYWLSSKEEIDSQNVSRKLKHIIHLIIGAEIFHFIFSIILNDLTDPVKRAAFLETYFSVGWIERWIIINTSPVFAHLWFLYALATIYFLILVLVKNKKQLRILALAVPFLLIGIILMQEFSFLNLVRISIPIVGTSKTFFWAHTIFFRAIPWFLMGVVFRDYSEIIKKIPLKLPVLVTLIIILEISAGIESLYFSTAQFYVGNIIATVVIMITCCKYPHIHCKPLECIGRELFTWIYICHVSVDKTLDYITVKLHIDSLPIAKWLMPLICVAISILIAIFIEKFKRYMRASR